MENIRAFLDQKRGEEVPGLGEISHRELLQSVREALELLEDFRSRECADRIEELCRYHLDADTAARLQDMQEQLRLYEDDTAEELLRRLIEGLEESEAEKL